MSTQRPVSEEEMQSLSGRTVLVTGGASGIGRALVKLAHGAGAKVAILDVDREAGQLFAAELGKRALFVYADVSNWDSILNAFETTYQKYGTLDVVYANAGVHSFETLLEDELDGSGRLKAPNLKSIEINLHGTLLTTKTAVHFFQKQGGAEKRQLIITGSAASLIDCPPLYLYCTAKAGVLGLMRGLRTKLPEMGITINLIAPWMTVSPMLPQFIRDLWEDLPANSAEGVAKALVIPAVRPHLNGRTLWIAGNNAIELEEALHDTQPKWIGSNQLSRDIDEGQRRMGIPLVFSGVENGGH